MMYYCPWCRLVVGDFGREDILLAGEIYHKDCMIELLRSNVKEFLNEDEKKAKKKRREQ